MLLAHPSPESPITQGPNRLEHRRTLFSSPHPVQATQPLFDSFGRTVGSRTYANAVIDLASDGSTSLASVGSVLFTTSTTYNAKGQTVSSTDPHGNVTNYEYDSLGRRTSSSRATADAEGSAVLRSETTYDSQGRVAATFLKKVAQTFLSVVSTTLSTTVPTYDPFGNVLATTVTSLDGQGNSVSLTTSATYDDKGKKLSETDAVNGTKSYFYDDQGRLVTVQLPALVGDGSQNPAPRPMYSYEYDARGNRTKITDPNQNETIFAYDDQGRQLSRTLPDGSVETFGYDDLGRQVLHVSFEGVVSQNVYSETTGRLAQQKFFDNLTQYNDGNGTPTEVRSSAYDHLGRTVATTVVTAAGTKTYSQTFDSQGRVASVTSPEGTIRYAYDIHGRMIRTFTGADANDPVNDQRYSYDNFGRLDTLTVYERNDVPLASNAREITDYDYDLQGNLAKVAKPNGVIDQYEYDSLNRLTKLTNYAPDGTPQDLSDNAKLTQYDYELRADGKKESETSKVWIDGVEKTNTFEWTYDENGRLTDEVFTSFDELLSQTQHFQLDLAGNRIEQTLDLGNDATIDKTTEYDYDENDRLLSETTGDEIATYAYDHTQQTEKTVAENSVLKSVMSLSWDVRGRLAAVTMDSYTAGLISRVEKSEYTYDEKHIRTSAKTSVDPTASGTFSEVTTTSYLNDAHNFTGYSQVIEEVTEDANGVEQSRIVYALGLQRISQATFDASQPNGVVLFFGHDSRGSTRILTDLSGNIATLNAVRQVFFYDAYGRLLNMTASEAGTAFLNTGEQFDANTGFQYNRERYTPGFYFLGLDPYQGDPWNPITFNKHLFANGDGANNIDPTGWEALSLGGAALFNVLTSSPVKMRVNMDFEDEDELIDELQFEKEANLEYIRSVFAAGRSLSAAASNYAVSMLEFMQDNTFDNPVQLALGWIGARACFVAGTEVVTGIDADGSLVKKPIEQIGRGDYVLARDEFTPEGSTQLRPVNQAFSRIVDHLQIVTIQDQHGNVAEISTTDEHPFWVANQGWARAEDLKANDPLWEAEGATGAKVLEVRRKLYPNGVTVYNFEVSDDKTYFVSSPGDSADLAIWVHNACFSRPTEDLLHRVNKVTALITKATLKTGSVASNGARAFVKTVDGVFDDGLKLIYDAGHLIGNLLGGLGNDLKNIVAMHRSLNRGEYRVIETKIANIIREFDTSAEIEILIHYLDDTNMPETIEYIVKFGDETIESIHAVFKNIL